VLLRGPLNKNNSVTLKEGTKSVPLKIEPNVCYIVLQSYKIILWGIEDEYLDADQL
jgi:hypothetical protein